MGRELICGYGMPLEKNNVDTDQIIQARFCYVPKRHGHENSLFGDWREKKDFVINNPIYKKATILVAGYGFATGSSREYAVWAIKDYGFNVVIAQSFGEIFYKNAIINDLLPVKTSSEATQTLWGILKKCPEEVIHIDLYDELIKVGKQSFPIFIESGVKNKYLLNQDDISLTMEELDKILLYESKRYPYLATTE